MCKAKICRGAFLSHAEGTLFSIIKHAGSGILDAILPPRCIVSGAVVERQGMVDPAVWSELDFIAGPICACCGFPFAFEAGPDALCAACLADRPPYETARAALMYGGTARDVILKFKHGDQLHAVHSFVPWLARAGQEMLTVCDVIVPVPLHHWRLFRRRYNQSALISDHLARACCKPCVKDALVRLRSTPSQGHLGHNERQKNVKNAFRVHHRRMDVIRGKTVVLVDDVYTTGATVRECTKALLEGGVAAVHVLSLARVVKPDQL